MRVVPTKDTRQSTQIKSKHRCAGIKSRMYVSEDDKYKTEDRGNREHNPWNSRTKVKIEEESKGKGEEQKGNPGAER
eukprot:6184230-Pleurochrysis_carterae.AAC.1